MEKKKIVRETKSTTISTEESLSERAVRTLQTAVRTSSWAKVSRGETELIIFSLISRPTTFTTSWMICKMSTQESGRWKWNQLFQEEESKYVLALYLLTYGLTKWKPQFRWRKMHMLPNYKALTRELLRSPWQKRKQDVNKFPGCCWLLYIFR